MNIRKPVDYSEMYAALNEVISSKYEQIRMYTLIGQVVSARVEKGAAVAAAEYLQERYPDILGFSPRNLRRMREFYCTYAQDTDMLNLAMQIGWTQNVVILEAELTVQERAWYIRKVIAQNWSKKMLEENIQKAIHLNESLDGLADLCYTIEKDIALENHDEKDTAYQPGRDGRVDGRYHQDAAFQGIRVLGEDSLTTKERRLRRFRPPNRHGTIRPAGYVPHLRRRLCWENVPPDRVYRP